MTSDNRRILELLADGRITVDEAARLLAAMQPEQATTDADASTAESERSAARYLRIVAGSAAADSKDNLSIRIPLNLLRAGAKLRAFVPQEARDEITEKLRAKGLELDPFDMSGREIDDFLRALTEFELEASDEDGRLRLYVE